MANNCIISVFIEMRINQLREEGAKEDIDLGPALLDYYTRHMKDGTFVSWLAVDDGKIIGTSGMSFVEKPRITDALAARGDCYPACTQIPITDGWELPENYCTELLGRQGIMAVGRFGSRPQIWA